MTIGDETTTLIPEANVSLSYDITPKVTAYTTFDYSQYTHVGVGGGLTPGNGANYNANDFHNESFLEEAGLKASLTQGYAVPDGGRLSSDARVLRGGRCDRAHRCESGFEFEANWQPNKNFYMTFGYTLTEAFLFHESPGFVSQLAPIDKLPVNADGTITLDAGGDSARSAPTASPVCRNISSTCWLLTSSTSGFGVDGRLRGHQSRFTPITRVI